MLLGTPQRPKLSGGWPAWLVSWMTFCVTCTRIPWPLLVRAELLTRLFISSMSFSPCRLVCQLVSASNLSINLCRVACLSVSAGYPGSQSVQAIVSIRNCWLSFQSVSAGYMVTIIDIRLPCLSVSTGYPVSQKVQAILSISQSRLVCHSESAGYPVGQSVQVILSVSPYMFRTREARFLRSS